MKKIIAACIIATAAFAACKKSDKKDSGGSDALTGGKWQITSMKLSTPFGSQELMDTAQECEKDNFILFNTDKSLTMDEGATKCDPSDPQTTTDGTWDMPSSAKLTLAGSSLTEGFGNITFDVKELSTTTLKVSKDSSVSGFNLKLEATLKNIK
jgi:hypothetical protein